MRSRSSKSVVVASLGLFTVLLAAACSERRRVDTPAEAATEALPAVSPSNYVPPATYPVESYSVPAGGLDVGSPLSDQDDLATGDVHVTDKSGQSLSELSRYSRPVAASTGPLMLQDEAGPTYYTGFPIRLKFAMQMQGGHGRMIVDFGLIEKAADGAPPELASTFKACNLGSTEAVYDGTTAADGGVATFAASFIIPQSCLRDGQPTRMMLYVAANPDGAVVTQSGAQRQFIVLDNATIAREGICLKLDKNATECQNEILVAKAPGANVRLVDFVGDNSVAVLPAVDPLATITREALMPRPFLSTSGAVAVEGLAPDDPDLARYSVEMRYELCAGSGDPGAGPTPECDANVDWQRLNVLDGVPAGEAPAAEGLTKILARVTPGQALGFSAPLHAMGAVYDLMETGKDGVWSRMQDFTVRACASLLKDGEPVEQWSLDSQAVNGIPRTDDCRLFPVLLADERKDAATTCVSEQEASGGASLRGGLEDCEGELAASGGAMGLHGVTPAAVSPLGARAVAMQDEVVPVGQPGKKRLVVTPSATYSKSWVNFWGSEDTIGLLVDTRASTRFTPMRMEFSARGGAAVGGLLNVSLFSASFASSLDLSSADRHWIEPEIRVLDFKIFGRRSSFSGGKFEYTVPVSEIAGTIGLAKSVKKAKNKKIKEPKSDDDKPEIEDDNLGGGDNALYVKEHCVERRVQMSFVTFMIEACGDLGLYLTTGVSGEVREPSEDDEEDFPDGKRVVQAALFFIPAVASNATLEASVGIAIARVGVGGTVLIVEVGLPVTLSYRFGNYLALVADGPAAGDHQYGMKMALDFTIDLTLEYLTGKLYVFAAIDGPRFCEAWGWIYYPCGWGEMARGEITLFDWEGGTNEFSLLNSRLAEKTWKPFWATTASDCQTTLRQWERIERERAICSPSDTLRLKINPSGGLAIMDRMGNAGWKAGVDGDERHFAVLTDRGNLELRKRDQTVVWQSNSAVAGDSPVRPILSMRDDGGFHIYSLETGSLLYEAKGDMPRVRRVTTLVSGATLDRGVQLESPSGAYYGYFNEREFLVVRASDGETRGVMGVDGATYASLKNDKGMVVSLEFFRPDNRWVDAFRISELESPISRDAAVRFEISDEGEVRFVADATNTVLNRRQFADFRKAGGT